MLRWASFFLFYIAILCVDEIIFPQTRTFMNKLTMDVLIQYNLPVQLCLTLLLLKQGHLVETWAVKMLNDWEQ